MTTPETIADTLIGEPDLSGLEIRLAEGDAPIEEQTAVKLARSKAFLWSRENRPQVSVVFAMYRETTRMLRPDQHPHGEDFINRKADQLRWLFDGDGGWEMVMVDDGCPDGSGALAQTIVDDNGLGSRVRVLYLQDAIDQGHPAAGGLTSTDVSRKGGSILYGMYEAAASAPSDHVVVYTDADLSTNLGQTGLLVKAIDAGASCAAGSRREPTSVLVKSGARNDRGKLFIYLWKQMLPQLRDMIDTQCGFKGFRTDQVAELVSETVEKRFAFDIELLLKCALSSPDSITRVPVAWVDSEEASTTTDLEPYLDMLQAVARMYRHYCEPSYRPEEFALFIEELSQSDWQRMVASVPGAIVDREPHEYSTWAGVSAADLRRTIT